MFGKTISPLFVCVVLALEVLSGAARAQGQDRFKPRVMSDREIIEQILTEVQSINRRLGAVDTNVGGLRSDVARLRDQLTGTLAPQYACTANAISQNMSSGATESCSPYTCRSIDGRCPNPPTCRTSDDCANGFACSSGQICIAIPPPQQP